MSKEPSLTPTTSAGVLHAGLSYRIAAFAPDVVAAIAARIREGIARLGR